MIYLGTVVVAALAVAATAAVPPEFYADVPPTLPRYHQPSRPARRSSPLPDEHANTTKLTVDTFNSTTSEGTWLVEFFLPTCPHCQQLAPIWEKLESDFRPLKRSMNFHFGQVNCAEERALCTHTTGVPLLQTYRQQTMIKTFTGSNTYEEIADFIKGESSNVANPFGTVVSLSISTFDELTGKGPWFVEFFAPWCVHCKELAPIWELVARRLQYKVNVGKVDCESEKNICKQRAIRGYPTIRTLHDGGSADYKGARKLEDLVAFAEKVAASKVEWVTHEEFPKISANFDVIFIVATPNDTAKDIKDSTMSLAREFSLKHKFLITTDLKLASQLNLTSNSASLAVLKDGVVSRYEGSMWNPDGMRAWVRQEKFPLLVPLNADTASDVLDADCTLVLAVLPDDGSRAGSNSPLLLENVKNAARAHRDAMIAMRKKATAERVVGDVDDELKEADECVMFAWIDGSRWAEYVARVYGVRLGDMPAVIIARTQQDCYWDVGADGKKIACKEEGILQALADVQEGKVESKSTIGLASKVMKAVNRRVTHVLRSAANQPFLFAAAVTAFICLGAFVCNRFVGGSVEIVDSEEEKAD